MSEVLLTEKRFFILLANFSTVDEKGLLNVLAISKSVV